MLAFCAKLEEELFRLQRELESFTYVPGAYRLFLVEEPKRRLVSAAPFRDRVVHHALIAVIAPALERRFLSTSYANLQGYGTHRGLRRFYRACASTPAKPGSFPRLAAPALLVFASSAIGSACAITACSAFAGG